MPIIIVRFYINIYSVYDKSLEVVGTARQERGCFDPAFRVGLKSHSGNPIQI